MATAPRRPRGRGGRNRRPAAPDRAAGRAGARDSPADRRERAPGRRGAERSRSGSGRVPTERWWRRAVPSARASRAGGRGLPAARAQGRYRQLLRASHCPTRGPGPARGGSRSSGCLWGVITPFRSRLDGGMLRREAWGRRKESEPVPYRIPRSHLHMSGPKLHVMTGCVYMLRPGER